jgi:hypothetical protein
MPNLTFDTLELVPEGLKEHAKSTDGKFVVDVVPQSKLAEFRENNITVSRQRDDALGVLSKLKPVIGDDVDLFLTSFGEMKTTAQQVKDGKLKATDAIETEVQNRVSAMKTGYDTQIQTLSLETATSKSEAAQAKAELNRSIVERAVTDAVVNEASGANPGALSDILTRAYSVFKTTPEGKLIAKEGEAIIYGADGATPMTPLEWMAKLRVQAPYLFKSSNGGGATGNTGNGSGFRGTGLSEDTYRKLSPLQKLTMANEATAKAAKR